MRASPASVEGATPEDKQREAIAAALRIARPRLMFFEHGCDPRALGDVFRARAAAASESALSQLPSVDGASRSDQPRRWRWFCLDRRLAGGGVLRARCRPRLSRLPPQLPQRAAERDDPARRRCLLGRAGKRARRAPPLAVPAVLDKGDP